MAAKKKRSPKGKKSAPKKKPAVRKKTAKRVKMKVSPRMKAKAPARAKPAAPKKPTAPVPKPTAPVALPGEERVGVVTHYFTHLAVAVVQIESGTLRVGDTIHIKGHTSDFRQRVGSMQIEHASVPEARAGQSFGLKVSEHAREHDAVYKVVAP